MLCIFVLAMLEPVLLCGCTPTHDNIKMEISDTSLSETKFSDAKLSETEYLSETELFTHIECDKNMTDMSEPGETGHTVYIYVCGAVELPGVYCLRHGSRLYEAVELAGGLTGDADDTCLNMAREIVDGEQIVILTQEETALLKTSGAYLPGAAGQEASDKDSGLVNINTATIAELTSVSGIGESRAQAIIDYREKNGSFRSIEDIKKVEGIKDGLFSKIKDKIKI
ncbi:MAG: helix-hairpin-helix domain-containing protein [Lachnospiraceae bacterium]|nr:helix-hairpin-helix domain-containing protein [Lachnospiraceae bacterium]